MDDPRPWTGPALLEGLAITVVALILGSTVYAVWIALVNWERIGV